MWKLCCVGVCSVDVMTLKANWTPRDKDGGGYHANRAKSVYKERRPRIEPTIKEESRAVAPWLGGEGCKGGGESKKERLIASEGESETEAEGKRASVVGGEAAGGVQADGGLAESSPETGSTARAR